MKRRAAALCALTVLSMAVTAGSAHAAPTDRGPRRGRRARRLRDLRRGRPLGRQHQQQPVARGRPRLERLPRRRRPRVDPRLPPLQGGRDPHRRDRVRQPRLLRRTHVHAAVQQRLGLQARARLLRRRRGSHRPGEGAAAVRLHASGPADHGPDQREQLRLRRRRPDLRDRLADLAVVVEELLQRRREHPQPLHRQLHRAAA